MRRSMLTAGGAQKFALVGGPYTGAPTLAISTVTDLSAWTSVTLPAGMTSRITAMEWVPRLGKFFLGTMSNGIWSSADGVNWNHVTAGQTVGKVNDFADGGGYLVAATALASSSNGWRSADGSSWTALTPTQFAAGATAEVTTVEWYPPSSEFLLANNATSCARYNPATNTSTTAGGQAYGGAYYAEGIGLWGATSTSGHYFTGSTLETNTNWNPRYHLFDCYYSPSKGLWFNVGLNDGSQDKIATAASLGGVWTSRTATGSNIYDVLYVIRETSAGVMFTTGYYSTVSYLATSTNGLNWTQRTMPTNNGYTCGATNM